MENYYDTELLRLIAKSNLRTTLAVRRFVKKTTIPLLLFAVCWALWFIDQVWALATLPHITYLVR